MPVELSWILTRLAPYLNQNGRSGGSPPWGKGGGGVNDITDTFYKTILDLDDEGFQLGVVKPPRTGAETQSDSNWM